MPLRFFLPALILTTATAFAQEASVETSASKPSHQQDLSLFLQSDGPRWQSNSSVSIQGLMYRRAMHKAPGTYWKLGLGTGTSEYTGFQFTAPPTADTVRSILYNYHERVFQAMGGLETERQLWRGIYLTAGLEVQVGSSGGYVDSLTQTTYQAGTQTQFFATTASRHADTRNYFSTGLGVLGIRAYTRRFTAGLEVFTGARAALLSQTLTNDRPDVMRHFSIFDFSAGGFGSRLSVGYRF